MKFRVGDVVTRTKEGDTANNVTKGRQYRIVKLNDRNIMVIDDHGVEDWFNLRNFELQPKYKIVKDIINDL